MPTLYAVVDDDGIAYVSETGELIVVYGPSLPTPPQVIEPGNYVPLNTLHRTIVRKQR
jgi:hypothetical protein